jgi:hypothetical protein
MGEERKRKKGEIRVSRLLSCKEQKQSQTQKQRERKKNTIIIIMLRDGRKVVVVE